mgnify:FL=1
MNDIHETPERILGGYQRQLYRVLSTFELMKKKCLILKGRHDDPSINALLCDLLTTLNRCCIILHELLDSGYQEDQNLRDDHKMALAECDSMDVLMHSFEQALIDIKKLIQVMQSKAFTYKLADSLAALQVLFDRLLELKRIKRL